jgi:hypothetical protein
MSNEHKISPAWRGQIRKGDCTPTDGRVLLEHLEREEGRNAALRAKNEALHKALMLLLEAVPPYRADGSMMISDAVIEVVNQVLWE